MWINKNVYLYEKNLKETRIETLEGQVAILTKKLETAESLPSLKPSDCYTVSGIGRIRKQKQHEIERAELSRLSGLQQAQQSNYLSQLQGSVYGCYSNPLSIAFGGAFG